MSNRRKARNTRRNRQPFAGRPEPKTDEGYVHQPAVALNATVPGSIEEARRQSHDALIEQLGDTRRSGVWWTEHRGADARQVLADLYADDPRAAELADTYAAVARPGAVMVMAWCIAALPDA